MSRIFSALAIFSTLLLCTALGFGLWIGRYNENYAALIAVEQRMSQLAGDDSQRVELNTKREVLFREMEEPQRRARVHILLGILSGLVAILVNSISVTYFIGTGRWCKEVAETYNLDPSLSQRCNQLKRRTFAWALSGMLTVLLIVGLGGASDPGTLRATTPQWVTPHHYAAWFGAAWIAISFMLQMANIRLNSEIIDEVVQRVHQIRVERGLDIAEPST